MLNCLFTLHSLFDLLIFANCLWYGFQNICSIEYYLQKNYYKTASLISNSCKSVAILAGHTAEVSKLAYEYGRNLVCNILHSLLFFPEIVSFYANSENISSLDNWKSMQGLAFQLTDDVLDFTGTSASLGKGSLSDIRNVIITTSSSCYIRFPLQW
jgi:geranyl diphosphate synthase